MNYHAKSLDDIAKHFDDLAKASIRRRDFLKKLRPRGFEARALDYEINAYTNARDIIKSTKLEENSSDK